VVLMNVLLSIKPKYVEEIKNGNKRYEFRKSLCNIKNRDKLEKIFIYSSSPIKKIVARFLVEEILEDHPEHLWNKCKDVSGIEQVDFFKYFKGKDSGLAIKISELKFFKKPIEPEQIIPNFSPPQSFCYVEDLENDKKITNFL
jgi:predicted transcriptional regulator